MYPTGTPPQRRRFNCMNFCKRSQIDQTKRCYGSYQGEMHDVTAELSYAYQRPLANIKEKCTIYTLAPFLMNMNMDCLDIFNYLPESVVVLNLEGNVLYANTTFESNIAPLERIINLEFVEEFIASDDIDRFQRVIQMAIQHQNSSNVLCSNSYPILDCRTLCFDQNDYSLYRSIDWNISCGKNDAYLIITGRFSCFASHSANPCEQELKLEKSSVDNKVEIESELMEFFQKSPIAFHWLNSEGIIIWANQAELKLLGYSSDEYVNHHISEFCPEDAETLNAILEKLKLGETIRNETLRFRTNDNHTKFLLFDASATFNPIRVDHDDIDSVDDLSMTLRHIRCFLRDDTDRIIMNAVNCYEKEQLVEATQEKVAFLNAVAHEIKGMVITMKDNLESLFQKHVNSSPRASPFNTSCHTNPASNSEQDSESHVQPDEDSLLVSNNAAGTMEFQQAAIAHMEAFASNTLQFINEIDFAMHFEQNSVRILVPKEIRLMESIKGIVRSSRTSWLRKCQSELSFHVITCSGLDDGALGFGSAVGNHRGCSNSLSSLAGGVGATLGPHRTFEEKMNRISECSAPIPDCILADSCLTTALQYLVNAATAFSPDQGQVYIIVDHTIVLDGKFLHIVAGKGLADLKGLVMPSVQDGVYKFQIVFRHSRPIDALAVYKSFKSFSCPLELYIKGSEPVGVSDRKNQDSFLDSISLRLGLFVACNMINLMNGSSLSFAVAGDHSTFSFSVPFRHVVGCSAHSNGALEIGCNEVGSSASHPKNPLPPPGISNAPSGSNLHPSNGKPGEQKMNNRENQSVNGVEEVRWKPMQESPVVSHLRVGAGISSCETAATRPLRILIVDDSLLCQRVLANTLTKMGFLIDVAHNGREACDKLVHIPCLFDAVIIDVIMPIMDGYTATKVCRQELHLTLPIIALSADVLPGTSKYLLDVGASAFLVKPAPLIKILEILHEFEVSTPGSIAYLEKHKK